ncbi:TPA: hypothetical protein QDZ34_000402 [Stenotrophomonas maltophilia]|nr:hypothetical protein [Stenotrophomonas maltophilia]HDS1024243.1 hypothetical protein [Stenotrophomonas maltophilia]HDS1028711.1 hypothetical protein [Stenotrophomonas maltophilia]HDS1033099.1 hypothetical protein [Stenotrophomonas maltophilia]
MAHDKQKLLVEKFHKATVLLAEKLVGEDSSDFSTFPFVVKLQGGNMALFMPGADPNSADHDYLHAFVVNAGLTLELKLKHLHALESGTPPRGHNLVVLFDQLGDQTKEFIRNHIRKQVEGSQSHLAISDAAKNNLNIDICWDARFLLDKSSYAFERWRYIYEEQNKGSWFCGYIELYRALEDRIESM